MSPQPTGEAERGAQASAPSQRDLETSQALARRASAEPVRVKICGIRTPAEAASAVAAGADMIGLNFSPQSRRYVEPVRAVEIAAVVPASVWKVGIFVDAAREEIARIQHEVGLTAIQLHGDEPPDLLRGWQVPVIRALHLRSAKDAERAAEALSPDYFLCEGASAAGVGGVGASFDWRWALPLPPERLFVAGGLTPENVAQVVRRLRPFAVDVASGVESSPGVKEPARVAAFVEHAKAA